MDEKLKFMQLLQEWTTAAREENKTVFEMQVNAGLMLSDFAEVLQIDRPSIETMLLDGQPTT